MSPRHAVARRSLVTLLSIGALALGGCSRTSGDASSKVYVVAEDGAVAGSIGAEPRTGGTLPAFEVTAGPAHGTVSVDRVTGAFVYTPAPNFHGEDAFTCEVGARIATAVTVLVTVRPVNDLPVALDGAAALDEDGTFDGQLVATDVDGDPLGFEVVTPPRRGRLTIDAATGTYAYAPPADFHGTDSFWFVARDAAGATAPAAVVLTVRPVNDAPVAAAQRTFVGAGGELQGMLWAEDVDGDAATYAVVRAPAHGALSLRADGTVFVYHPEPGFTGADSFDFTASDGIATSAPATVTIDVRAAVPAGPQVQLQQGRTTVPAGAPAVLGVTASGAPPLAFVWRRNGIRIPGANGARYVSPPLTPADSGAKLAVTVYNAPASTTSLTWVVEVVELRPGQQVVTLHDDRAQLYPALDPVAVRSITPLAGGIGARIALDVTPGGLSALSTSGDATVTWRQGEAALDVRFEDSGAPEVRTARVSVGSPGGAETRSLALSFANDAWFAAQGAPGPARVTVTELGIPAVASHVEDWIVRAPTADEVAFATTTWGAAVAAAATPTEKAQALAVALIDELEPHRGVPSNAMNVAPFLQYQRAMAGLDQVWCTNIAAIYTLASNALGIPARIVAFGRTLSLGSDYRLQTAEGHASTEIFDADRNAWVWVDPTMYLLGIEEPGLGLLDTIDMQRALNDPTRSPVLSVVEYAPGAGVATTLPASSSTQWPELFRFFGADTLISLPKLGSDLPQEYYTNEEELFPRLRDVALRELRPLVDGAGVELRLTSGLPDLTTFELRQTYASWGPADPTPRQSQDGRFVLEFPGPHEPVSKAMQFRVKAVGAAGPSAEPLLTIFHYPTEFYAARGLTQTGLVIFTRGDLPVARSDPFDWIVDEPTPDDHRFAKAAWGGLLAGETSAAARAAALGADILGKIGARQGVPTSAAGTAPLDHYRRVLAGQDVVDSRSLARILARACNALGIPARVVEVGRVLGHGQGYDLLGAELRGAVEVFDAAANRWAFVDPSSGVLGAELDGYGLLNSAELARVLDSPAQVARLTLLAVDPLLATVVRVPAATSPAAGALRAYFRTQPAVSFARRAR